MWNKSKEEKQNTVFCAYSKDNDVLRETIKENEIVQRTPPAHLVNLVGKHNNKVNNKKLFVRMLNKASKEQDL